MNIERQMTLGETLLLFAGCLEMYARRDWSSGSKEPRISPQGRVLPPMSIEDFARCKIGELQNIVDWLGHLISAVLKLRDRQLSDELGSLLLQAKPYLEGNLDAAELSLNLGKHATAVDDVCIRAFGAAYTSIGQELERIVARLRVHEMREELKISAPTDAIDLAINEFLWKKAGSTAETKEFRNKRHDELLELLRTKADVELPGKPIITMTQSLQDAGCDLVIEWGNAKYGIQLKSHFDIREKDFAAKTSSQIQNSRQHGLKRLYVLLAGDLTDTSQQQKVRGFEATVSKMNDPYVRTISPERVLTLLLGQ